MAKAHTLVDNFNDNSFDSTRWQGPFGPTLREVNGRVEFRLRAGEARSVRVESVAANWDLTGSYAHVEVVRPAQRDELQLIFRAVNRTTSEGVWFILKNRYLQCTKRVSGVNSAVETVYFDAVRHRWWRLREQWGTTYFEVSADGLEWMVLGSTPNPVAMSSLGLSFEVNTDASLPSPGVVIYDNFNVLQTSRSRRVEERRDSALAARVEAAELAASLPHAEHFNNNDEANQLDRPFVGNYSKSLKHDSLGDPDPVSYGTLLRAMQSADPGDFEEIRLGATPPVKLTNPQSGFTFDPEGPDPQAPTMPPAPPFDSEQTAHEAGELYWMALARDIAFINWPTQATTSGSVIQRAIDSLNNEFPYHGGDRPVTVQTLFRGDYPGEQVGPYVSQFLLKGNVDPRKPDGLGRDANEGYISYGAQVIDQRIIPAKWDVNHLTSFSNWLNVQNGTDTRGGDQFDTVRRFIRDLRGGTTYVHFDQVLNAFYNAAWILMSEPTGNQLTFVSGTTGRPQLDAEFPFNPGNPYDPPGTAADSKTQVGFGTFGTIHILQVLGEVLGRAIRAMWWQKWGVHRRLRPEEYGGRVHNHITGARTYATHASIRTSLQTGLLSNYFNSGTGYLLPQAYAEGSPTHPAYGSGHAVGSGACATMLKALFDESVAIENPVQASADGLSLVAYTSGDAGQMTVGGELNKLAGNISIFRNAAGVHWRTDYSESLPMGETVAIRMLQEMSLGFNEDDAFFELTRFDGQKIRVFDGKVVPV